MLRTAFLHTLRIYMPAREHSGKLFWSGGSQAVRLPKAVRLPGRDVTIKRRGKGLVIEPVTERDDWRGFWDALKPLGQPLRRWKTPRAEKRRPF